MGKQYIFYFDAGRCVQCRTCVVACKSANSVEPGINWRKVLEFWEGDFPEIARSFLSVSCMHCAKPACLAACPTGAISKRVEDGIVVVDKDKCDGCKDCLSACPFDVPQFGKDGIMQKCDFCLGLGKEPACVSPCPTEALHYGTMEELTNLIDEGIAKRYNGETEPSFVIKEAKDTIKQSF